MRAGTSSQDTLSPFYGLEVSAALLWRAPQVLCVPLLSIVVWPLYADGIVRGRRLIDLCLSPALLIFRCPHAPHARAPQKAMLATWQCSRGAETRARRQRIGHKAAPACPSGAHKPTGPTQALLFLSWRFFGFLRKRAVFTFSCGLRFPFRPHVSKTSSLMLFLHLCDMKSIWPVCRIS